jgi:hypothetical protein
MQEKVGKETEIGRTLPLGTYNPHFCAKISLSRVFACQYVGVTAIADDIWLVSFMDYDLGFFDNKVNRVEPVG